ncbi:MAG: hypothetical protein DRJ42_23230 [Deltaproteobacteria bacterium]|nr:MAG: hypothetical protein DRJ42_23230 [Deltaproteobacteria bacterium]
MSFGRVFVAVVIFLTGALVACGDDSSMPTDSGMESDASDTGPAPTCDESTVPSFDLGDPDGHAAPLGVGPGEARAGRAQVADLPVDPEDLATYEAGDFILANEHIAILIEDAGESQLYNPWGGQLVGAFEVEGGALVRPADFNEFIVAVGRYTIMTESVTVMADGSDGGAAIVRAVGPLRALPFLDEFAGGLVPDDYDDISIALDYVLEPGADTVQIQASFQSIRPLMTLVRQPLLLIFQYGRMPAFTPGGGFDFDMTEPTDWLGFVEDGATSYAFRAAEGVLTPLLEVSGTLLIGPPSYTIEPCTVTDVPMGEFVIGGPGVDGLRAAIDRADDALQRTVTGAVTENDGSPAAGVRVHVELDDGTYFTRAVTDAAGSFSVRVPETAAVNLYAYRRGQSAVGPVAVAAAGTTADLTLGPVGQIEITATDMGTAEATPVRIQVFTTPPSAGPPAAWGEPRIVGGRSQVVSPADGHATVTVGVGDYTVFVSKGFEYEAVSTEVTVADGATETVVVALERVVDTTGVMCGDFHIHTTRSPDAIDSAQEKLLSAAGDGLEIPVRTDHEFVSEFETVIAELGLEGHMFGVSGIELTTFAWGHFGVFPLEPDPSMRNDGAFEWPGRLPPDVFEEARGRADALIVNHPRGFGVGGYFSVTGYDAATGSVRHPELWDEDFSVVEVFNDSDFDANYDPTGENDATVNDWFSFLNAGRRVFAVGASDSHKIYSSPVGYPRTCMELGTDDPATLRAMGPDAMVGQINAGQMTVSGGIYVDALAAGGAGPGDDVLGAMARELISVRVQAANFIDADRLRVFVDGALAETIALDATTEDPMEPTTRFDADIEIDVAPGGSWVIFVADGTDDLVPLHPGRRPFGVTNPIFFNR